MRSGECAENSGGLCKMVKGDPRTLLSVALTKRAVAIVALRRGHIRVMQGPVVGYDGQG